MIDGLQEGESVFSEFHGKNPKAEVRAFVAIKEGSAESLAEVFKANANIDRGAFLRFKPEAFLVGGDVAFSFANAVIAHKSLTDEQRISLMTVLYANNVSFSGNQHGGFPVDVVRALKRSKDIQQIVEKFALR